MAPSTTTPHRDAPSSSLDVTPSDGSAASHSAASRRRSLVHAGQLVQAMLGEEAERVNNITTAAGLADVKTLLLRMYDRVDVHANSQAATNTRTDSALGSELKAETSIVGASGATEVLRSAESRMGSV